MRYLLVVDLQQEFVKDKQGQKVYDKCLRYIKDNRHSYDAVVAAVYKNEGDFINMQRLLRWEEMKTIKSLDFTPDKSILHNGYSARDFLNFNKYDQVDVIGFDTDACVLSMCFDLFNVGCNIRIIADGCWSSGGKEMHKHGLAIMRRQFRRAVDENTRL